MTLLLAIVRFGLVLILFTPLLVSTRLVSPFLTAKVLAFQILVEVVVIAVAGCRLLRLGKDSPGGKSDLLPYRSPLLAVLAIFLGYSLVTAFFGVDFNRSLWGTVERQDGLILQIHFLAWLTVIVWYFSGRGDSPVKGAIGAQVSNGMSSDRGRPQDLHRYLKLSFWVSTAVAATVIYEWLELRFKLFNLVPESVLHAFQDRVGGVFGNPLFAGVYMLFHFFYGLYLLSRVVYPDSGSDRATASRKTGRGAKRWSTQATLTVAGLILLLTAILIGQIRGVFLGLAAGLLAAAVGAIISKRIAPAPRIAAAVLTGLFVLSSLLVWQARDTALGRDIPFLKRLIQTRYTELSVSSRIMAWDSAGSSVKDHPILGWGTNNVYYGLNEYYNPALVRFDPDDTQPHLTWYDKAHNAYLDLLAERGVIGAVLFILLVASAARSLWVLKDRYLALFLTGSLTGYLVSNSVAFDSFGSFFGLYLFLAPLVLFGRETRTVGPKAAVRAFSAPKPGAERLIGGLRTAAALILIAVSVWGLNASAQTGIASFRYLEAQRLFARDPDLGLPLYQAAFQYYSPYRNLEKLHCAILTVESILNKRIINNPMTSIQLVLPMVQQAAAAHPQDVSVFLSLADMFNNLAIVFDRSFLDNAEYCGRRAQELSPKRQEAAFCLGRTYILRGNAEQAVDLNRKVVSDYPDYELGHWFLGLSLIADAKRDEAKEEIRRAFELGFSVRNAGEESAVKGLFGEYGYHVLTQQRK